MGYKIGERVWCDIGIKGGDLPWRKGTIIYRTKTGYRVRTIKGCFDVNEKNMVAVSAVEAGGG